MRALVLRTWPVRVRLVAAFIAVMVAVLTAAGAFVYWRVEVALDRTLDQQLADQADTVRALWERSAKDPVAAMAGLPADVLAQVLDGSGVVLAGTPAAAGLTLLPAPAARSAARGVVELDSGNVLTGGNRRVRGVAFALSGGPAVAVTGVRLGQRDEALRELLAQLATANLVALAVAAAVGHRLARAALLPVERYRRQAQQITEGASGVRLDVAAGVDDEVSRLGHTLNQMLSSQEEAAHRQRQFIADASHELRSPLAVLSTEVELALRRPRSTGEYHQALKQVAVDTARLVTLAEQLLDLEQSYTSGSTRAPGLTGADLEAALHRAVGRGRQRLDGSGRAVALVGSGPGVGVAAADLDQVLGNLVDNAALHGAGDVTVTASYAPGWVVLAVHDEGGGPPVEFVGHAVERFRRADEARTTPGNGLGLALVHSLLGQAGGELRLCASGRHHRYPPLADGTPACDHALKGTTVTALLPAPAPAS